MTAQQRAIAAPPRGKAGQVWQGRPTWRKLLRRALKVSHSLRWKAIPPDYNQTYSLEACGFELMVLPSVFHPRWHFTSLFFAEQCGSLIGNGKADVLEIGTGSGLVALAAARAGAQVTAVDINPVAVQCARLNALNNGLAGQVELYEGDMFAPVGEKRFDLVLCNPPYFRGSPGTDVEQAYMAGDQLEWIGRFAREAHSHVAQGGALACVFGDAANVPDIVALVEAQGWSGEVAARRDLLLEELTVWLFRAQSQ